MNEWLKKILEAAKINEDGKLDIDGLMGQINTEFPKNAVPKETFNDINGQLKTATKTITDLKAANLDNEALQQTVKQHEEALETQKSDFEKKMNDLVINGAIEKALLGSKAKHSDLLTGKIDREKLIIGDGGKVIGIDEQISGLKESYKDLFEPQLTGKTPENTGNPAGAVTKEQFAKMGYNQRVELFKTNKELYDQLNSN